MKTKGSFILKASTALVLALLMLFGTVTTSLAAVVDDELAENGAQTDLAETGVTLDDGSIIFCDNHKPQGWGDYWFASNGVYWFEVVGGNSYIFELVSGTAGASDAVYGVIITDTVTFTNFKMHRCDDGSTGPSDKN